MSDTSASRAGITPKAAWDVPSSVPKKFSPEDIAQANQPILDIEKQVRAAALAKQRVAANASAGVLGQHINAESQSSGDSAVAITKSTAELERVFEDAASRNTIYRIFQKTARDNDVSVARGQIRTDFAALGTPIVGSSSAAVWANAIFASYEEGDHARMMAAWQMMQETHPEPRFLLRFMVARMGQRFGRRLPFAEEHVRQYGLQKCKTFSEYSSLASAAIAFEKPEEFFPYLARIMAHPSTTPVGALSSEIDMIWDTHNGQMQSTTFYPYSYLCHGHCSPVLAQYSISPATLLPLYCGDDTREARIPSPEAPRGHMPLTMDAQLMEQERGLVARETPDKELEVRKDTMREELGFSATPYVKGNPYTLLVDLRDDSFFTVLMQVRMILRRLVLWCRGQSLADLPSSDFRKSGEEPADAMRRLRRFLRYPVGILIPKNYSPDVRYILHGFGLRFQPFSLDPYTPNMMLRVDPCDIMAWAACGNMEIDHDRSKNLITAYRTIEAYELELEKKFTDKRDQLSAEEIAQHEAREKRKYDHLVKESIQHLKDKRAMIVNWNNTQDSFDEATAIETQVQAELQQRLSYRGETTKQYNVQLFDPEWNYPQEIASAWELIHKDQAELEANARAMRNVQMDLRPELVREFWYELLKPTAEDEMLAARERELEDERNLSALLDHADLDYSDEEQ